MRNLNLRLFLVAALLSLLTTSSSAQVTGLKTRFLADSIIDYCSMPAKSEMWLFVSGTGTSTASDSLTFTINFGDGTDTSFKSPLHSTPGEVYAYAVMTHVYTFPGTFTSRVIVTAPPPAMIADTVYGTAFTVYSSCGTISGNLYMDANGNCIRDTGEDDVSMVPIVAVRTATSDTFNAGWANRYGDYRLTLVPGSYTIIPNYYYTGSGLAPASMATSAVCPATGLYTLTVAPGTAYTYDFAYDCAPVTGYDAGVVLSGGCFFPGDTTLVSVWAGSWAWYYHYFCIVSGLSTNITVNLDPTLTYIGALGMVPTIAGSTLTYNLSTPANLARFYSGFYVRTPTTASIGDTIRMSAYIAPLSSIPDPDMGNNTYNYKKAIATSFDPNVKEVAPQGKGEEGFVARHTPMTYTIHFQNTGTAAARNITITDEIDPNLDLNSFHLLGSTHNAGLYKDGRKVIFRFENIYLPDSGTDYQGSMGSVTYAIKQKKDLPEGTKMQNTAAIYFDYNAPIITNTTLNTIEKSTVIEHISLGAQSFAVYPNPADGTLNIRTASTAPFTAHIIDMMGRVLIESSASGRLQLNTASLSNGTYILRINDAEDLESSRKIQVLH